MSSTIFIVDSSPAVRRMVEQISTPEGYDVVGFEDGPAALEAARQMSPELIIADYHLENITFSGFCKEVHKLDNLSETYIISLVSPADRPDESHLRSLGVKAFLKKPFQSDNLLDLIKDLQDNHRAQHNATKPKTRVWPPQSVATDSDSDASVIDTLDDQPADTAEPTSVPESEKTPLTAGSGQTSQASPDDPEDSMKGFFERLLVSMTERAEQRITELLPRIISKELTVHIKKAVQEEVRGLIDTMLTTERISALVRSVVTEEVLKAMTRERANMEPIVTQAVAELTPPLVKERLEGMARDLTDAAVRRHVPDAVREHLGSMEVLVKEEIQQAASRHGASLAEGIVRVAACERVEQAVERIVPEIAESQVKAELKRLTAAE